MNTHFRRKRERHIRNENPIENNLSQRGFFSANKISLLVFGSVALLGSFYLYSINKTAVLGFSIRTAENKVATLRQENNQLKIKEAELKSLYRIEETGQRLNMFEVQQVRYLDESSPLALR